MYQARILYRCADFFGMMFKKVANGKIPGLKLVQALENLQAKKPIFDKEMQADWAAEVGGDIIRHNREQ